MTGPTPIPGGRSEVARALLPRLVEAGSELGWERRGVVAVMPRGGERALLDLLKGGHTPTMPSLLERRVATLLCDPRSVDAAFGHGDPMLSNVLSRRSDDALVLLDWELAGRLPVGHDAAKLVLGSDDALGLLMEVEPRFASRSRTGDLPWRRQVAVGLVRMLCGWRRQQLTAATSGRTGSYERSLLRRLSLLDELLI